MAAPIKVVTGKTTIVAHPFLFTARPESSEIDAGKFTAMVIVRKSDTETVSKLKAAVDAATKAMWPDKVPSGVFSKPVKDGDAKFAEDEKKYHYLKGTYFLNVKTTTRPKVFDAQVVEMLDPAGFVSGDFAKVSLNFKAFDKAGNKGVGVYLNAVQHIGKGPEVLGGGDPSSDFEKEEEEVADVF